MSHRLFPDSIFSNARLWAFLKHVDEAEAALCRSTIERWYYQARSAHQDPVKALRRRVRTDAGRVRAMSPALITALREQYSDLADARPFGNRGPETAHHGQRPGR